MDNRGEVTAKVCVRCNKQPIWLTEVEFLKVFGTAVKQYEQVTLMIGYYLVSISAERARDIIEDAVTARALDKFPGDWEVDLEEL